MPRRMLPALPTVLMLRALAWSATPPEAGAARMPFGDFTWMHGANYIPS